MCLSRSEEKDLQEAVLRVIEVPNIDDLLEWIKGHLSPDDIFGEEELEAWAEANGYIRIDD
jgi:hypothetical protein